MVNNKSPEHAAVHRLVEQAKLRACRVRAGNVSYVALFPTTIDAVMDAQERFPQARRIAVEVLA